MLRASAGDLANLVQQEKVKIFESTMAARLTALAEVIRVLDPASELEHASSAATGRVKFHESDAGSSGRSSEHTDRSSELHSRLGLVRVEVLGGQGSGSKVEGWQIRVEADWGRWADLCRSSNVYCRSAPPLQP